jgi:hypothetical protein
MSRDSGSNTVRMAVRPIELWRTARWHCECGYSPHEWTLRLFVDEVIATECVVDNVAGMVRIAQQWRHAVLSDVSGAEPAAFLQPLPDRRQNVGERRAVPRGGRRGYDPGHSRD